MRIINIVDSISELNFGVWNAAIINSELLIQQSISMELWHPGNGNISAYNVESIRIKDRSLGALNLLIKERYLNQATDIIITSGVWQYPTRWGAYLHAKGFRWVLVPQGMLEPWPMKHKWFKKIIYFFLVEKRLIEKADLIRAVSSPEFENLKRTFRKSQIRFIPNGVKIQRVAAKSKLSKKITYLFLSRLHSKKNIVSLVQAWLESSLNNSSAYELKIAGPDQGELSKIDHLIRQSNNVEYLGSVTGEEKSKLLNSCTFYVLPSFSEGLPSALLEAMAHGLIPIITEGCNLPDVETNKLGRIISTSKLSIKEALEETSGWENDYKSALSERARQLILRNYSLEAITRLQIEAYRNLLGSHNSFNSKPS